MLIYIIMKPIPEATKQKVIELWLSGYNRDEIAQRADISTGAVTNIAKKFEEDIGKPDAEAYRELAKSIRAADLYPAQCAVGLRISNIFKKIGLDPETDNVERFLSETYKECVIRR